MGLIFICKALLMQLQESRFEDLDNSPEMQDLSRGEKLMIASEKWYKRLWSQSPHFTNVDQELSLKGSTTKRNL